VPTPEERKEFLEKDFYDSLRWLFVSAVIWHASEGRTGPGRLLGMYTNFVEARALYEFYCTRARKRDDARAHHFSSSWTEPTTKLYLKYMGNQTPAQKRVFHLVYGRSTEANAGAAGREHPDHLKNQVLNLTRDLLALTTRFVKQIKEPEFRAMAQKALEDALIEAKKTAKEHDIPNPL
jgi:hypothetical protein